MKMQSNLLFAVKEKYFVKQYLKSKVCEIDWFGAWKWLQIKKKEYTIKTVHQL